MREPPRHLIIGGVYKSATTSLYHYLSHHPHVCASNLKETSFFLDADYPVPAIYRYTEGLALYGRFFDGCTERFVRMESSPFYFHSPGTPGRIKAMLDEVQVVFVLRDPIDRLRSCHRYERLETPALAVGFDEYVSSQADALARSPELERSTQLAMGRYARYLRDWLAVFGPDAVIVVLFEDLVRDPLATVDDLCRRVGLEAGHYREYRFKTYNRSVTVQHQASVHVRSLYDGMRFALTRWTLRAPALHRALRQLKHRLEPFEEYLMTTPAPVEPVSLATSAFLVDYYRADALELERLMGRPLPWPLVRAPEAS